MAAKKKKSEAMSGKDALDYIRNAPTGEPDVGDSIDQKDVLAGIERALSAKLENFKRLEDDFWAPWKKGREDQSKTLRGLYLGRNRVGKLLQHTIATKDTKGRPVAIRFNGTVQLTRALKRIPLRTPVHIEYMGKEAPKDGKNAMLNFGVKVLG